MILSRGDLQITTRSGNLGIATFSLKRVKYLKLNNSIPPQRHSIVKFHYCWRGFQPRRMPKAHSSLIWISDTQHENSGLETRSMPKAHAALIHFNKDAL